MFNYQSGVGLDLFNHTQNLEDLDISDGQVASVTFLAATYGDMPEPERTEVMADLEQYCGRDTEGMIWIVEELEKLSA